MSPHFSVVTTLGDLPVPSLSHNSLVYKLCLRDQIWHGLTRSFDSSHFPWTWEYPSGPCTLCALTHPKCGTAQSPWDYRLFPINSALSHGVWGPYGSSHHSFLAFHIYTPYSCGLLWMYNQHQDMWTVKPIKLYCRQQFKILVSVPWICNRL